tara:strand:+ start:753 stop:983 length:231 start_codon:yes stop_codon:yes gene_type:complete
MKFPRERTGESRFFFCQVALRKNLRSQVFSFGRKAAGQKNNLRSQVVLRNASAVSALLCCIIVYNKTSLEKGESDD